MSTISIGNGAVLVGYPDGEADGTDNIGVDVDGVEVAAWSIAEDPKVEAEECARGYSAVYEKGYRDGLQKSVDLYHQQAQAMAEKEAS